MNWEEIDGAVRDALRRPVFPGCVVACGRAQDAPAAGLECGHVRPYGRFTYAPDAPEVRADTLYDLASLTKVVVTTTLCMQLVEAGALDLDTPVAGVVPEFRGEGCERVTARHLLTHSSGLPAWLPLYREAAGKRAILERVLAAPLEAAPGERSVYSDIGFILLGEILERLLGAPLDIAARGRVLGPLEMRETTYRPGPELIARIPPTEEDPWRGHLLRGEVHDENAFALGSVAPNAGLFGPAGDLARFARFVLAGGEVDGRRVVGAATVDLFTRRCDVPGSSRALGWDTPAEGSSAGSLLSQRSVGHTGFTGTSLWIDLERGLYVILLSNRVHPSREPGQGPITAARRAVADAVVRGLRGA